MTVKKFIENEIHGWMAWEVVYLTLSCILITFIGAINGDTILGIISALSGILYVLLNGKGKPSAYIFGLINSVLYGYISFKATLYGETMLNFIYYVPMQFVGFYIWTKNINADTNEVYKRQMSFSKRLMTTAVVFVGTLIYGFILRFMGDNMPYIDAFTTVASVVGLIVAVRMYTEQWVIWFIVDFVTVIMWFMAYRNSQENIATCVMWVMYTITAVVMLKRWNREIKREQNESI